MCDSDEFDMCSQGCTDIFCTHHPDFGKNIYKLEKIFKKLKFKSITQQKLEAEKYDNDFDYPHCSICGVKIDYGNTLIIGDYIFCGDINHCKYHHNCKNIASELISALVKIKYNKNIELQT